MALTAYEMYNYCLQFLKRSAVAKSSGQSFLVIFACVHLADVVCRQLQPSPRKKFKEVIEEAVRAHFPNICLRLVSSLTVLSLFPTEEFLPQTQPALQLQCKQH